jgi:hypothetical protein
MLSKATLPKESLCGTDETPLERCKTLPILFKFFLIAPIRFSVDFVLLGRLLRLFETFAGDIRCGLMAIWFVRYIQLETRTSITARGRM